MTRDPARDLWREFVNPDFVGLLESLHFRRRFVRAEGTKLYDDTGREYTDFLSGFGVHNIGHNHPRLIAALRGALDSNGPSMLNMDTPFEAGLLAERLSALTHPALCRTVFANSGAEAVEIAIKTARAATGRKPIVACSNAYHGLTTGALELLGCEKYRRPFLAESDDSLRIPFGNAAELDAVCTRLPPAAFIVEPIQAEGGIHVPAADYLPEAARICRSHGCLLVIDEIQTGLGRTGRVFASVAEGATESSMEPPGDIVLAAKALSGGIVPVAAAIMTADVWKRAFGGAERCVLASSTFAGGRLAMIAGLETLAILQEGKLAARARQTGDFLFERLRDLARRHEVVKNLRGEGLLAGVELAPPPSLFSVAVPKWAREAIYGQVISAILLRDHAILTQPCSLAPRVFRVEPPLTVSREEIERFVQALDQTLSACPSQGAALLAGLRERLFGGKD